MTVAVESQQMPAPEKETDEKSREIRLGLVMYGGVSLAIYINGVAQEFFRAVRGRGIYRLIKALTDSDVVVDVISGTSAGGINGIFLAYALCNGKNFAQFANLWREHGDIGKLLRAPDGEMPEASSFLDSEGYYQPRLEDAFRRMDDDVPEPGEDPSELNELDLFITGTDVDGRVYTQFDDAGHAIDIKDHRAVFLLKHRKGRKEQLRPGPNPEITFQALAKLSRLTSGFPAAFAPVHVDLVEEGDDSADAKLQTWGKLGKEASFLDGGLLDNKPFTYTLKAIFSRTADREVDRKLFYVEPDPEVMRQVESASAPNFLQAVLAALIGIPGYESIADDLRLLAQRNSKLVQYRRLVQEFQPGPVSAETRRLYARSRLVALSERVVEGLFRTDGRSQQIPPELRARAAGLVREFDDLPLNADSLFADFDVPFRLRRVFRMVYLIYDLLFGEKEKREKTMTAERERCYRSLWQGLNRQIKLYEILQSAMESLVDDAPIPWKGVRGEDERHIWLLVEAGYHHLLEDDGQAGRRIRLEDLEAFLRGERQEWLSREELEAIRADLRDASGKIIDAVLTERLERQEGARTFLGRVDACERLLLEHFVPDAEDPLRKAYATFEELDAHLFPLELVGDLHEKDVIETIRISPRDAIRGFSSIDLPSKVAGDAVYHFGGFFKRSWRSNDILWGRLDGLCQLVETLLDHDRIEALVSHPAWRARLRSRFFDRGSWRTDLDPAALFPRSGERTHEDCRRWLSDLLEDDDTAREAALATKRFHQMVSLLVEAAQLEVIAEDLPHVVTDAIQEQSEWNLFQIQKLMKRPEERRTATAAEPGTVSTLAVLGSVGAGPDERPEPPPWIFQAPGGRLDPFVATAAAAVRTMDAMAALDVTRTPPARPLDTRLGRFFKHSYRIGSEELTRDVPTLVLLEILAKVLLVARTCILGLFKEDAPRIRRSLLYRLCLDWPLRSFYALVGLARRAPGWGLGVFLGLGAVSLLALVVGIVWWPHLVRPGGGTAEGAHLSRAGLTTFIAAPAAILLLQGVFLLWGGQWLSRRRGLWAFFATLASIVALVLGGVWWDRLSPFDNLESRLGLALLIVLPALVVLFVSFGFGVEAWRRGVRKVDERKRRRERQHEVHLRALRRIASEALEERFGQLPRQARRRLETIVSVEDLGRLLARSGTAASLADLGLAEVDPAKRDVESKRPAA